jgi:hypothetical protein
MKFSVEEISMKNDTNILARFVLAVLIACIALPSFGQGRIVHKIDITEKQPGPSMGRDLWFTMARNYESQAGKYYELYVTSPNATTVNIQVTGGTATKRAIKPLEVFAFKIPLGWEVTTSGIVEDLAIRVWSNDADLTAYMLSRNPATSDGMYIIPTIGWGTEYVVAGYHSLYEGFGTTYDYPSEFNIVANQDNTICTIIPSGDIRKTGLPNDVLHQKGVAFTETLNRGQVVQYMLTLAQNADDYDVTGSIVRSNKPVGVIGASQCPNIPPEYPYCDHICDMIPPVRTWATTYYSLPFYNRKGGDSFLMIGSKKGQTIYFNSVPVTTLDKFGFLFRPDFVDAGTWTSDAPFLLAQYINSTTWVDPVTGTDNNGIGDPAMVVINSKEQYTKEVVFQTPTITTGSGFTHYANILVHEDEVLNTTVDGIPISSYPSVSPLQIPFSDYIAFRARSLKSGAHHVKSGQGVGVYVYGYGSYDSYAWAGALGTRTFNDPDTIAPVAKPDGICFDAHVDLTDNHTAPPASKILDLILDSIYNMRYTLDPNFVSGGNKEIAFYDMTVIDPNKDAYLRVTTIDGAGNRSVVTSSYQPMTAVIDPPVLNFGKGVTGSPIMKDFTITNTGAVPYKIQSLFLFFKTRGFKIENADLSDIPVGGSRLVTVSFEPNTASTVEDTLIVEDGCTRLTALMFGNGGKPDFRVTGYKMTCELVGSTYTRNKVLISNTSDQPFTIEDIWVDDVVHFGYNKTAPAGNVLPFTLAPGEDRLVETTFKPDAVAAFTTTLHAKSTNAGEKTALLEECGIAPSAKTEKDQIQVAQCASPVPFVFTTTADGSAPVTIEKIVVVGDPGFGQPVSFTNIAGTTVTLPITLQPGESVNANVLFTPQPQASGIYTAQVFAISTTGDTTNKVTATVDGVYRIAQLTKGTATIPIALFGSPKVTEFFTICNPSDDSLTIFDVSESQGFPKYKDAFDVSGYRVGTGNVTLPYTLGKNECLDILVDFDPSKHTDAVQQLRFNIATNACYDTNTALITAGTKLGPPSIQGFSQPMIFSCTNATNPVHITNPGLTGSNLIVKNIQIAGNDPTFFTIVGATPTTIAGGRTEDIMVQFNPALAVPGRTYTADVIVDVTKTDGVDTTMIAQIDATANGMTAQVSSTFAVAYQKVKAGAAVVLPITLAVNKNGLNTGFDVVGVRRIVLVYKYNSDILDIANDDAVAAFNRGVDLPGDWNIDVSSNVVDGTNGVDGTLTVILTGQTPLPDNVAALGEMEFGIALSKYGKSTNVTLESAKFYRADQSEVQGCFNVTTQGTSTELIYECGDQTLIDALNGQTPSSIAPASPNPVTRRSDLVTLRYAVRYMSPVTLSIYDELGQEVKRIVDTRQHPAGAYEVKFDASTLSSGTYTYRLMMDNSTRSGRFVVNY